MSPILALAQGKPAVGVGGAPRKGVRALTRLLLARLRGLALHLMQRGQRLLHQRQQALRRRCRIVAVELLDDLALARDALLGAHDTVRQAVGIVGHRSPHGTSKPWVANVAANAWDSVIHNP